MEPERIPVNGNGDHPRLPGAFPSTDAVDTLHSSSSQPQPPPSQDPSYTQSNRPPPQDRSSSDAARDDSQVSERQRPVVAAAAGDRRPSAGTQRVCGKCGKLLNGQFIRALENVFHLECFTCNDCGKVVASKFFPVPDNPPGQYPLCEVDYFKRLDLICYECGNALRGSYITALDRKYHVDHFTCSMCPTVFGAQDSYYEHENQIYCHYHYSTKFAQRCNGCQTAILKQFVEIFRGGVNQHWHPECYMIHKYWNVRLQSTSQALEERAATEEAQHGHQDASQEERDRIQQQEEKVEGKVLWIWRTLSAYEEKSAGCISDMLLHVSNGAYMEGVAAAKRFILHVDLLFAAADKLDLLMATRMKKGLSYSREAKLLCKKVVSFFQLLAESQDTGVRRLGVTQELLSLVTGLAHYLKLLIRICLQGTLKLERETVSEDGLRIFLDEINSLDAKLADGLELATSSSPGFVDLTADTCPVCQKAVEDRCFRHGSRVIHQGCMTCTSCQHDLSRESDQARWSATDDRILCAPCASQKPGDVVESGFAPVTRLQQYIHLLRVAHARLLATLRSSGALPHTSDDPNLAEYDNSGGHGLGARDSLAPGLLRSDSRSKSYGGGPPAASSQGAASYEQTLGDIRRMKSTRLDRHLSNADKRARTSRVIGGPDGSAARPGSAGADGSDSRKQSNAFHIVNDREISGSSQPLHFDADKLQLDDIPRLVAAEQAKDQRPNANRYARGGLVPADPRPIVKLAHRRDPSGAQELEKLGPDGNRPKKYFSELTALEYFIVRHVAVLSMEPLLEGHFNQEELLDLIEMRKQTFWGKFGKAFSKNDKARASRKGKAVFGVSLDQLVERDGVESNDGVGPGGLRIPSIMQDALTAMRTMDMSMEGVFRKNGNIRRLKEMAELYDTKGGDAVDLTTESPLQVAALLKKFLRELPDPVMTYKLHRLFVTSQRLQDDEKRRRVLHLALCLLPKSHRDTMEVLFNFLNWAASFSVVDEESGSKMDVHNLATVIAPNVLFSNNKVESMEDSFLAIEAVHSLLQYNDVMCEVPEDLQSILNDSTFFASNADITTKEILKRYGDIASKQPTYSQPPAVAAESMASALQSGGGGGGAPQPIVHRVESGDIAYPAASYNAAHVHGQLLQQPALYGGPHGGVNNNYTNMAGPASPSLAMPPHNGFYTNPTSGSRDSFGSGGYGSASAQGGAPRFANTGRS